MPDTTGMCLKSAVMKPPASWHLKQRPGVSAVSIMSLESELCGSWQKEHMPDATGEWTKRLENLAFS
jgi:hypothetical protein